MGFLELSKSYKSFYENLVGECDLIGQLFIEIFLSLIVRYTSPRRNSVDVNR